MPLPRPRSDRVAGQSAGGAGGQVTGQAGNTDAGAGGDTGVGGQVTGEAGSGGAGAAGNQGFNPVGLAGSGPAGAGRRARHKQPCRARSSPGRGFGICGGAAGRGERGGSAVGGAAGTGPIVEPKLIASAPNDYWRTGTLTTVTTGPPTSR